jgi:hypothetical protein
MKEYRTILD